MWVSSHSSAGRRRRRNTEDVHKLKLDMARRVASSPTGELRRQKHVRDFFIAVQTFCELVIVKHVRCCHEEIRTGQMRETRRPVVAISLSGSKRSLS